MGGKVNLLREVIMGGKVNFSWVAKLINGWQS
jgi:hypothetical protein